MLDLHNHVLPGLDDGARDLDESLALLRAQIDDGVQHVVCTPHIYPGVFDNTVAGIEAAFTALRHEVALRELPVTLSCAAEVRVCGELLDWLRNGELPLLAGGGKGKPSVLLELPDGAVPLGTDQMLDELRKAGISPIIAHPERNRAVMQDPDKLLPLLKAGARLQITAGSVLGEFGGKAKLAAMTLLQRGQVDFVASDSHNMGARRPRMRAARAWLVEHFGEDLAERLTETNPAAVAGVGEVAVTTSGGWSIRDLPKPANAAAAENDQPPTGWGRDALTDWAPLPTTSPDTSPAQTAAHRTPSRMDDLSFGGAGWATTEPTPLRDDAAPLPKPTAFSAFDLGQLQFPMAEQAPPLRPEASKAAPPSQADTTLRDLIASVEVEPSACSPSPDMAPLSTLQRDSPMAEPPGQPETTPEPAPTPEPEPEPVPVPVPVPEPEPEPQVEEAAAAPRERFEAEAALSEDTDTGELGQADAPSASMGADGANTPSISELIPITPAEPYASHHKPDDEENVAAHKPRFWQRVMGWLFGRWRRDGSPAPLALESRLDPDDAMASAVVVEPIEVPEQAEAESVPDIETSTSLPIEPQSQPPNEQAASPATEVGAPEVSPAASQATSSVGFKLSDFEVITRTSKPASRSLSR